MSSTDSFPETADQARTDIALTRREMAETAQALAYKLNVSERTREQLQHGSVRARKQLQHGSVRVKEQVQQGSMVALRIMRHNELLVAVSGALAILGAGGLLTWRIKR